MNGPAAVGFISSIIGSRGPPPRAAPAIAVRDPAGGTISLVSLVPASGRLCFRESTRTAGNLTEFYYAHHGREVLLEVAGVTFAGELAPFWHDDERLWRLHPKATSSTARKVNTPGEEPTRTAIVGQLT